MGQGQGQRLVNIALEFNIHLPMLNAIKHSGFIVKFHWQIKSSFLSNQDFINPFQQNRLHLLKLIRTISVLVRRS